MNRRITSLLCCFFTLWVFIGSVFAESEGLKEEVLNKEEVTNQFLEAVLDKLAKPEKPANQMPEKEESKGEIIIESANDDLMTINFLNVDIREALSALAIEREINIATAQGVSGNVSVHLFQVSLDEALNAITLAGGLSFQKEDELYYVYKPTEVLDPMAGQLQMHIFKLKYTEIEKVQEILSAIPGMRTIKIHEPSRTIIVEDTPENIAKIKTILGHWDRRPKQVMIEAKILEITLTDDMSFGINWRDLVMGDVKIGTGGLSSAILPTDEITSPAPATGTGLFANLIAGAGTAKQFTAALDFLQTKTRVNTLSTPKILAIHGKPAKVQVGGQQGYRVTTTNVGVATETVQFIDTGTILEITPFIYDDNSILLEVKPSINSAKIEDGIPVVSSTQVSTWLMSKNGETVFIGGLIQDTKTKTRDMIPCLGGIPALGALFGRTLSGVGKSELVVLITPSVLLDAGTREEDLEFIEKTRKIDESFKKEPLPTHKRLFDFTMPVE